VKSETGRPVGVIGLKDVVIVDTKDGLLLCSDSDVQRVREVYRAIK
jgi:hypothetical protein